jgi:hypothetical protein
MATDPTHVARPLPGARLELALDGLRAAIASRPTAADDLRTAPVPTILGSSDRPLCGLSCSELVELAARVDRLLEPAQPLPSATSAAAGKTGWLRRLTRRS